MNFQFTHPYWLLLALPALAWVFWLGWRTEAQLNPFRKWAALILRVIVTLAIVFAMAGLQWLRPVEGMNVFFVFDDGSLSTPPLGTILPGITRDSIIALAKDSGTRVREETYTIQQWRADAASGKLKEAFACGTAAVISPIGKVCSASGDFLISGGAAGPVAMGMRKKLVDIQYGRAEDPHEWIRKVL